MTFHGHDEATLDRLTHLPLLEPDKARAERTRLQCRAQLERRMRNLAPAPTAPPLWPRFATAILGVFCLFCVVYVASLFAAAVTLGIFRY